MRPVRKMIMLEHLVSQDGWHIVLKTCVTAAGSFTVRPSVFPVIPAVSGILSLCMGFA